MLDRDEPDLGAMLGFAAQPMESAPPPVFRSVAEARGDVPSSPAQHQVQVPPTQPPMQPAVVQASVVQQVAAVADAADQFNPLYGVAEHETPKEYAEALGKMAAQIMTGGDVENAVYVAAAVMTERMQSIHGVSQAEAYDLTRYALILACTSLVDDILDRKVFKGGKAAAQNEYRQNLILRAIKQIQIKNMDEGILGVTVANILNRIGRKRWTADAVQVIIDNLLSAGELTALAPELKPGRKSVRYIIRGDAARVR